MKKVKVREAFRVLADESAEIAAVEQLVIVQRYFNEENNEVHQIFVGFVDLKRLGAKSTVHTIGEFLKNVDLNPNKCFGFGFDGYLTMSGKHGEVQAILRKKNIKTLFFHCSSHKLKLVINDLNTLP